MEGFRRVLAGLDTVQVCYYLRPTLGQAFSFEALTVLKERARASKIRDGVPVDIGGWSFQLRPSGSGSGYPLILEQEVGWAVAALARGGRGAGGAHP